MCIPISFQIFFDLIISIDDALVNEHYTNFFIFRYQVELRYERIPAEDKETVNPKTTAGRNLGVQEKGTVPVS